MAYKQCRGSCGLYYVLKTKYPNTETLLLVTVRPGNNIYDYLTKKDDGKEFTIKRTLSHHGEYYFVINRHIGEWINLIRACSLVESDEARSDCYLEEHTLSIDAR